MAHYYQSHVNQTTSDMIPSSTSEHHCKTSTLSPRQRFQSRIRDLSDEREDRLDSNRSNSKGQLLQHISSLRVQPVTIKPPKQQYVVHRVPLQPGRSQSSTISRTAHREPAFAYEEQAGRNERSQRDSNNHTQQSQKGCSSSDGAAICEDSVDSDSSGRLDSMCQNRWNPPLRPFAPSTSATDVEERPKTSKGLQSSTALSEREEYTPGTATENVATRRSKFVEGSMTDRSVGIASNWPIANSEMLRSLSNETMVTTDSEETLKASQDQRDSSSLDLNDFKPLPSLPSTSLRQRIFNLGVPPKPAGEARKVENMVEEQPKKLKKRLRKSMSSWNLPSLSGKMKIFGASTHELDGGEPYPNNKSQNLPKKSDKEMLQERKRKAEEVYAKEFGFKKQKSNAGLPRNSGTSDATIKQRPPRLAKERSLSAIRTISKSSTTRRKVVGVDPFTEGSIYAKHAEEEDINRPKKLSRKELETENARLRNLLREQEKKNANITSARYRSASISSVHLPVEPDQEMPNIESMEPQKKTVQRRLVEEVPPMPPMPSPTVLSKLNNEQTHGSSTKLVQKLNKNFSRPVSMIMEVDEVDENRNPNLLKEKIKVQTEPWEWPEDVF